MVASVPAEKTAAAPAAGQAATVAVVTPVRGAAAAPAAAPVAAPAADKGLTLASKRELRAPALVKTATATGAMVTRKATKTPTI